MVEQQKQKHVKKHESRPLDIREASRFPKRAVIPRVDAAFMGDTTDAGGRAVRAVVGTPRGIGFALNLIPFIQKASFLPTNGKGVLLLGQYCDLS